MSRGQSLSRLVSKFAAEAPMTVFQSLFLNIRFSNRRICKPQLIFRTLGYPDPWRYLSIEVGAVCPLPLIGNVRIIIESPIVADASSGGKSRRAEVVLAILDGPTAKRLN